MSQISLPEFEAPSAAESVLVFESCPDAEGSLIRLLASQIPTADIVGVRSLEEYRRLSQQQPFDVVVLDQKLAGPRSLEFVLELRLKDVDPAILVVLEPSRPQDVAALYNAGCNRCVVREGAWRDELGPAARHLMRIRKLEAENAKLVAKLTEANLLLAEKNRRLDEFSGTVAHDIRGPLGGISMKLEYLSDTYLSAADDRVKRLLGSTLESTQRLLGVVQAMYEFAKLGAKAAQMEEVALPRLVEEAAHDLNFDEALDISIEIGELPKVWGNADLLRKVFLNLLGNAVKYTDKPQVQIAIMPVRVVDRSLGKFIEFRIEDNGRGIPAGEIKEIFAMFRRGSNVDLTDGVGVGLAVVKRIIELHFGQVEAVSQVGQGTAFVISLPMERIELER